MKTVRVPMLMWLLLCGMRLAHAAEPPTAPILRIEAGMHTAMIDHSAVDDTGRLALTASYDKTARLWELPSGRLLRVLRPPIGDGDEGMLYACALSPGGAVAALGGFTGKDGSGNFSIYLFDTGTGRLIRRLGGLPSVIADLAFSAKGHFLAAVLGVGNGLRVWETSTWREVGHDADYVRRNSYGVDWHGEADLVTTCDDGNVRLYQLGKSGLKCTACQLTDGGKKPYSARFSPGGRQIAVGFKNSAKVAVLDGVDLHFLFAPDTSGVTDALAAVTWARDGAILAAGGNWRSSHGDFLVRFWSKSGRGQPHDYLAASQTVFDLRALPGGNILLCAGDPAWGAIDAAGKLTRLGNPSIADYRLAGEAFQLSDDGAVVDFGYKEFGKDAASFSVPERGLRLPDRPGSSIHLSPPPLRGLDVTAWKNTTTPKLAGQQLALKQYETSRSLAIAHDASGFFLGADWYLRSFTAQGQERWKVPVPDVAWAVNLADNDRLAVAAYGDGTIRWHRADTGQELLAFFPHADKKRWVLWAPILEELPARADFGTRATKDVAPNGAEVTETISGGAAERVGILKGDILVAWNGKPITSFNDFSDDVAGQHPGDEVVVTYKRTGETRKTTVKLSAVTERTFRQTGAYYDCSPGAESLMGWYLNRGKDQAADFFSAAQFRNVYYRPDVIQKVLKTRDVSAALREANRERGLPETKPEAIAEVIARLAPPVVELETGGAFNSVMLPAAATEVKVRYRVRQTGQEAPAKVSVRFNGRLADMAAPLPKTDEVAEISVPVPAGMAGELTIFAEHHLAVSEPAVLRIKRAEGQQPPRRPTLYVVSAGVAHFGGNPSLAANGGVAKDGDLVLDDIPNSDRDAEHAAAALQTQKGRLFEDVRVTTLTNERATAPAVREALRKVAREAKPEDVAMVFFSSHGVVDPKLGFYVATSETDPNNAAATAVTGQELSTLLEGIKARTILALDTCHAGGAFGGTRLNKIVTSPNDLTGFINGLSSADQGTVVFSSSAAAEQSLDDPQKGGLFTQAFCEALTNRAAADADGLVTCGTMQTWLTKRVPELVAALTKGVPGAPQQTPVCVIPKGVPDFAIAIQR